MKKITIVVSSFCLLTIGVSCSQNSNMGQTDDPITQTPTACNPLETREANSPEQQPAFAGQTRACAITTASPFEVQVLTKGLKQPWAVEPFQNGDLLVTEKPGRLRIVSASGVVGQPITGVPQVYASGQGGLLDIALSPNFATDNTIFMSYSEPRNNGNGTSVARGVLSADRSRLENVQVIFRAVPSYSNNLHYGSRLVFGPDNMLYITLGERSDMETRPQAQHMDSHLGKTIRITPQGQVPQDNPFVNQQGTLPEIWTVGHRNIQAAAFDQNGKLWVVEHGPKGGDELNLLMKGKNYGWPLVSYGEEYSGQPIATAKTQREGYEQPAYYWDPVIAPSGAQFYTGSAFPEWSGNLFVGGLKEKALVRLRLENNRVTGEEHLLKERGQRIRDVRQGPDGSLYVVTDQENGELWKITPKR